MTFLNFMAEFRSLKKRVIYVANAYEGRELSTTVPFPEKDHCKAKMEFLVETVNELEEIVRIKSQMIVPLDQELLHMYSNAIAKIASNLHGGQVFWPDTFKSAVEAAVDPTHKEFCVSQSWQAMVGVLREHPEVVEALLRDHGVLIWTAGEWDPADELIRVVNTKWLVDESSIWSHVVSEPPAGKTCRYCLALEPPESLELQPLDREQRSQDVMRAGMSGKRVAILQPGRVHCHVPCAPYWQEWVRIAEQLEEAAA